MNESESSEFATGGIVGQSVPRGVSEMDGPPRHVNFPCSFARVDLGSSETAHEPSPAHASAFGNSRYTIIPNDNLPCAGTRFHLNVEEIGSSWWGTVKAIPHEGLYSRTVKYAERVFSTAYNERTQQLPTLWHLNKKLEQEGFAPLIDHKPSKIMDKSAGAAAYFQCNNEFKRMIGTLLPEEA